jgi:hypothetical protein
MVSGLEGNEYISLLGWVLNTYSDLLLSPELGLSPESIPTHLLDAAAIDLLMKNYLEVGNTKRSCCSGSCDSL